MFMKSISECYLVHEKICISFELEYYCKAKDCMTDYILCVFEPRLKIQIMYCVIGYSSSISNSFYEIEF